MTPLEEAVSLVLDRCKTAMPVAVPIAQANRMVLAQDVFALGAVPPFPNTAMDGYALHSSDTQDAPVRLRVIGTLAAGSDALFDVGPGEAVRIMTGAQIPDGADAVVMVERTSSEGEHVDVEVAVAVGNHIRNAGDDIAAGSHVLAKGTLLSAGHLGVLASVGLREVEVFPKVRVGVLSTGDELVDDGSDLKRGQIRDSNRCTLLALLADIGAEPVDLGLVADDYDLIKKAISDGVVCCDALITSGGVSVGDFDFVKTVLDELGDMRWMQVAIRPAKPLAFGLVEGKPVFGLPGNPVSSMVSFELFARTGLRAMMGFTEPRRRPVIAVAGQDFKRHSDGKTHFQRVIAEWSPEGRILLRSAGGQGSHVLTAMAHANALAVVEDGDGVAEGAYLSALLLGVDELDHES